jgi:hypothetical protein
VPDYVKVVFIRNRLCRLDPKVVSAQPHVKIPHVGLSQSAK